jgi:hypothetical protein
VQSTKTAREEGADDRDQARSSAERHGRDEPAGPERARVSAGTGAARYEIRVDGVLDRRWTTWFEGLEVDNDGSQTVISGEIADQAALHGLLNKVSDLGLTLISVYRSGPDLSTRARLAPVTRNGPSHRSSAKVWRSRSNAGLGL